MVLPFLFFSCVASGLRGLAWPSTKVVENFLWCSGSGAFDARRGQGKRWRRFALIRYSNNEDCENPADGIRSWTGEMRNEASGAAGLADGT